MPNFCQLVLKMSYKVSKKSFRMFSWLQNLYIHNHFNTNFTVQYQLQFSLGHCYKNTVLYLLYVIPVISHGSIGEHFNSLVYQGQNDSSKINRQPNGVTLKKHDICEYIPKGWKFRLEEKQRITMICRSQINSPLAEILKALKCNISGKRFIIQ